jgi:L-iditol 2-dehydrogenase
MKAVVKYGAGLDEIGLRDAPKPVPGRGDILIKVMAAGICGTDLHIMQNEYPSNPPIILGHEYTGIVEALGEDVNNFATGDQVISLTAVVTCGHCYYCREALYMLCSQRKSIGSGVDGAMAEYLCVPARLAHKVPDNMRGSDAMALSEPIACCIRAVNEKTPLKAGDVAVISGPGAIGQITAQLAKIQGAYTIVSGTEADSDRLSLAKKLGADAVANSPLELREKVLEVAPLGADVVYECAGALASADACLEVVRKEGHFAQIGLYGKRVAMEMDKILTKELSFSCSYATEPTSWDRLIRLVSQKKLQMEPLISARLPLSQWREGFDMALNKTGYKILLIP